MIRDAEKYKAEDEEDMTKIKAMNALENYIYDMRDYIRDEMKMEDVIKQAFHCPDGNRFAEVYEFEDKMKELEVICNPTVSKMNGTNMVGRMDDEDCQHPKRRCTGPKIEEVD